MINSAECFRERSGRRHGDVPDLDGAPPPRGQGGLLPEAYAGDSSDLCGNDDLWQQDDLGENDKPVQRGTQAV